MLVGVVKMNAIVVYQKGEIVPVGPVIDVTKYEEILHHMITVTIDWQQIIRNGGVY